MWPLLLAACALPDPVAPSRTPPAEPCPYGMLDLGPGEAWLGAEQVSRAPNEIPLMEVRVERYCIGELPFPGQEGDPWPEYGLAFREVAAWEALLLRYGRRLCTPEELLWATAAGPANLPHGPGPAHWALCEPHDDWERVAPLGHRPGCVNPWGLRDLDVFSSWARASAEVDRVRDERRPRPWAVVGGTNRGDTFYAPSNFGVHTHGPADGPYFDDQLRICADPGAHGDDAAWDLFVQAAANQGSFDTACAWEHAFGPDPETWEVWTAPMMPSRVPWW
jgi:hypothetical protein